MSKKAERLGMTPGKARNLLIKSLIHHMACKLGENVCFICKQPIEDSRELSIEHKVAWLNSEDPVRLFFDLKNIGFSHHRCNCGAANNSKSGLMGATHYPNRRGEKKWKSVITTQGKTIHIGWFKTAEESADAYDVEAIKLGKMTNEQRQSGKRESNPRHFLGKEV